MLTTKEVIATSEVSFGTSGARGLVSALTDAVCFAFTLSFLNMINAKPGSRVAVGMDLRPSSPRITSACIAAIRSAGLQADFCGAIPTPALAFYAQEQGMPAIMITGSHIPFDRNGIKFYRTSGEINKADEEAITFAEVAMPSVMRSVKNEARKDEIYGQEAPEANDTVNSAEQCAEPLPAINTAAAQFYKVRYVDFFPGQPLTGMRLGFYQHSSLARDLLTEIAQQLGAQVIALGRTDQFVPIDTEAVSEADSELALRWVAEHKLDAIFSTDGDADRPLLGDEHGNWLRGDIVGILCAQYLAATAVVTPVSSNTAVEKCNSFAHVVRTRIGSPFVIAGMEQLLAEGVSGVVGYEANGGFLVGSPLEKSGRVLAALPTRDAVLPIVALLVMARVRQLPLSALLSELPPRYTASDRIKNFATQKSQQLLQQLAESPADIDKLLGDLCGPLVSVDQTDGLRMSFANGEIVHLRPSGNAPELRCYAEASSQVRAQVLAQTCLQRVSG